MCEETVRWVVGFPDGFSKLSPARGLEEKRSVLPCVLLAMWIEGGCTKSVDIEVNLSGARLRQTAENRSARQLYSDTSKVIQLRWDPVSPNAHTQAGRLGLVVGCNQSHRHCVAAGCDGREEGGI